MVVRIRSGKNIRGVLNYNEMKVTDDMAQCIQANLFAKEVDHLNFYDKLDRFTGLNNRNLRTTTNTLHISLNFHTDEKLTTDVLNAIASRYMDLIGFGEQPYLVYEHRDAAHPHVHVVSTLIQDNGARIPIHFLGKNQSEHARKQIENEFNLVAAQSRKTISESLKPISISKTIYGRSETKRSITNIVRAVIHEYKYTSLPEFNAVLGQFNVVADPGKEGTRMREKEGLVYSLIDEKGIRVGVPVKASAIYGNPGLKFLKKQFVLNRILRNRLKPELKNVLTTLLQGKISRKGFVQALADKQITVVFRTNDENNIYGITLVDNKNKVVFNGSDLGKAYGARQILAQLEKHSDSQSFVGQTSTDQLGFPGSPDVDQSVSELIDDLITARQLDFSPNVMRIKKKKRKGLGR